MFIFAKKYNYIKFITNAIGKIVNWHLLKNNSFKYLFNPKNKK